MNLLALSDIAREVDRAFEIIGGMSIVLLAGIVLAMLFFILRYRRGATPRTTQIHGNLKLEMTWIIIPTLLVIYMFFVGYRGFKMMREVPDDAMVVEVTGRQWSWSFTYPEYNFTTTELYLPGDRSVKFLLHSPIDDVVHSFYIPHYRIKEDCVPGRENYMWIHTDMPERGQQDRCNIFCAEFCGKDHSRMKTELIVLAEEDFDRWVEQTIAEMNKPVVMSVALDPTSLEIRNRKAENLYKTYCLSCHGMNGLGEAETTIRDARNLTSLQGWKQGSKLTDIFRTLTTGIEGTQMRSFSQLSAWDRFALAHHVADFYKGTDRPIAVAEEIDALRAEFALDKQPAPRRQIPIEQAMQAIVEQNP